MASTNVSAGVTVKGNVYGGGNLADVKTNTTVNIGDGQIDGNVYGGGNLGSVGTYDTSSDMKTFDFTANTGTCNVTIFGGTIGTGVAMSADGTFANGNVYGAGKGEADTYWCEKAMAYKTNVIINAGTVNGTVYGGGQIGRVENNATVIIGKENPGDNPAALTIAGNVFGAGAGVLTHGYSALLRGDTKVTIQGNAHIGLNVYGGGEKASVGRFVIKGGLPSEPADDGSGDCIVNVQGTAIIGTNTDNNITDKGNVYGTCQGVTPPTSSEFTAYNTNYTSMQAVAQKAPEGTQGTAWAYVDGSDNKYYWVYYETLDAYKEFLNTLALASHPVVTIGGMLANETTGAVTPSGNPTVNGSVFGGGQRGITLGTVAVNIAGGTIYDDVYGGGALADTNKGNQTAEKYDEATVTEDVTIVTGMYTRSGDAEPYTYTEVTTANTLAASGTTYYTKAAQSSINTTTVNLTGGYIKGDAYGGGLGQTGNNPIEAKVWGDISVNLGSSDGLTATAFNITKYTGNYSNVIKSGRVFGCNNLNGSPQGNVTVTVWKTVSLNADGTVKDKPTPKNNTTYELAAVYGGGNLANFTTTGKMASVIIETCDVSVQSVYGGGNAADVPETDVLVKGAYEIGEVFGGGNGEDSYTTDGGANWTPNPGADVNGNATTLLKGGYIHDAYGGSNTKGTISGNVSINKSSGGVCTLQVDDLYGAGKNADVEGDLIVVLGCSETRTKNVYGCAMNANVKGNVELTITSGEYGKVFGGNNQSGSIFGHIIVNIEETGCSPIIIDELYGCGNDAAYSVYGYYHAKKYIDNESNKLFLDAGKTIPLYTDNNNNLYKDEDKTIPLYKDDNDYLYIDQEKTRRLYMPRTSVNDQNTAVTFEGKPHTNPSYADPEVNIISCTRIGQVFGGGYGANATVYGNPKVNINMIKGAWAGNTYGSGLSAITPPDDLGKIGDGYSYFDETEDKIIQVEGGVFGGGNQAPVYGNTNVNIGTETDVYVVKTNITTGTTHVSGFYTRNDAGAYTLISDDVTAAEGEYYYEKKTVLGANITSNVYGGGKLADVGKYHEVDDAVVADRKNAVIDLTGNTNVNIGAKLNNSGNWESVAEGTAGVFIGGNVYGGGMGDGTSFFCDAAMVLGNKGTTESSNDTNNDGGGTHVRIGNGTINGNVYGGGEIARVERNTEVTIGFGEGVAGTPTTNKPVIMGTVFGAGAGLRTHGYSALVRGHSSVTIEGNAKVMQSVYGGGEMATVGRYQVTDNIAEYNISGGKSTVTIGGYAEIGPNDMVMYNTTTGKPDDYGHVFGAGKGIQPYEGFKDTDQPWSKIPNGEVKYKKFSELDGDEKLPEAYATYLRTLALTTETDVTIKDHAFVKGCVFGGSENGFVQEDTHVTIQDDCQIGNGYVQMDNNGVYLNKLETPATPMSVNRRYTDEEWRLGKLIPDETNEHDLYTLVHEKYYTSSLPECASWPYGQAANAADKYAPYDPNYGATGYDSKGGRTTADDGHTFYGSVFGGGSGYYPYKPGRWFVDAGAVYGNATVDITGGHILTSVYGGNEMTNVGKYVLDNDGKPTTIIQSEGGGGKCTVNFGGTATLGVPRTLKQISAHPVTCYLFGAGKGDQRVFFNKSTNVGDVEVNITGGTIYGSVFGGGEDGHVMRDVKLTIENTTVTVPAEGDNPATTTTITPTIGTWGTSYVDGNVFGGGRGFAGNAYTAGNVAGSIKMEIKGGNILGSIYGGGRLGSVGYGLFESTNTTNYGVMQDDNKDDEGNTTDYYTKGAVGLGRGHIDITISGGTIGNDREYIIPNATNMAAADIPEEDRDISKWNDVNKYWDTWKEYYKIPKTEFDTTTGRLSHTKGGNVFAGGMGNFYIQDGSTPISDVNWWQLGCAKSTKLTITGGTIKSNVYGGGELGQVVGYHTTDNVNLGTEITIQGSSTTIGTELKETITESQDDGQGGTTEVSRPVTLYTFGSVFGGGYGSLMEEVMNGKYPKFDAGLVKEDTKVDMQNGAVKASIYGGGEMASVGESTTESTSSGETTTVTGSTHVSVSGGTIGIAPIDVSGSKRYFGGAKMGNVYGGGSGDGNTVRSGKIFKNTNVSISGSNTRIYHNVYGGGAYGTVGDFNYTEDTNNNNKVIGVESLKASGSGIARVTITGGTIGYDGKENGMVFGSSRGDINVPGQRDDHTAWVYDTHVTIGTSGSQTGPQINGTVYGSGENGHVFHDTEVTINSGTIGIASGSEITYTENGQTVTKGGAAYPYRGNVYGGGCGTDKYYSGSIPTGHTYNDGEGDTYNSLAGIVYGTTTINITGGTVVRNVYGAGAMGSVGKVTTTEGVTTINSGGLTTINISGGQVGVDGTNNGNVFGAARGDAITTQNDCALVQTTDVNISGSADIKGSVYGGGETGDVLGNTEVNVCAEKQTNDNVVSYVVTSGTPTIGGNVFGGGMGVANSFTCSKAMVGVEGDGVTGSGTTESPYVLQPGGTTVRIYNGTVGTLEGEEGSQTLKAGTGNVYGGGYVARVERNTSVEIGAATGSSSPVIRGSVFAAGAGKETHGYSALVRGHSTVTVQGSAQVLKNVFGGGEKASVGRYKVKTPANENDSDVPKTLPQGMPARLLAGGTSTVNIQGSAVIGTAGNASTGHVYGAGQGVVPSYAYTAYTSGTEYATRITNSKRMVNYTSAEAHPDGKRYEEWDYYIDENGREDKNYVWEYFTTKDAYLQFIETLALSAETYVTIGGKRNESTGEITLSGTPTINGSVFGGSESGFVYRNTDVKIKGGTVEGDAFGGGRGLESFAEAGRVRWNTNLAISGDDTVVKGNVYGGGNMGDVGTIYKPAGSHDYVWKNTDSHGNNLDTGNDNTLGNNTVTGTNKNTGICTVDISGGTIGLASTDQPTKHGNVFGAGEGSWHTWWCEKAIVYATDVSVKGGTVYGNVYGGGEVGRVEDDAKVTIGTSGETGTDKPKITGSVFGGGAGLQTHGYSALVRGDSKVTVQGASNVGGNVYGGGEIASVGRFKVVGGLPTKPKGGGTCTVVVKDNAVTGDVYGSCKGVTPNYVESGTNRSKSMQLVAYKPAGAEGTTWDYYKDEAGKKDERFIWVYYTKDAYLAFLPTLGLASNTHVTIGGSSAVNGSVYGGGQRGITLGGVDVNINGGTVSQDVYGGGALANSNSSHWHEGHRTDYVELDELYKGIPLNGYYTKSGDDTYTLINDGSTADGDQLKKYYAIFKTNVNLKGGTIGHNVYGGGLGQLAKEAAEAQAAVLYANVNEYNTDKETSLTAEEFAALTDAEKTKTPAVPAQDAEDAIEAKVYGDVSVVLNKPTTSEQTTTYGDCEVKGTIFGCNNLNGSPQAGVDVHVYKTVKKNDSGAEVTKAKGAYEVTAVYGGGNLAAYYPDDATIRENATAYVTIDGCELTSIGSVYGGGNAASVPATEVVVNGTYEIGEAFGGGNGKDDVSYNGTDYVTNPGANVGLRAYPDANNLPYDTKQNRDTNYGYGPGKSHITIYGGTVHSVYGGSNLRGNVRVESRTTLEDADNGCDFNVGEAYGGGNNAPQDGDAVLEIGCISGLDKAYGGASNADVNGNVVLNITNGTYDQVFGGNDAGGAIRGSITVNIEETGCNPIIIGELYGGGCNAAYSVYGYDSDNNPLKADDEGADPTPVTDPVVNVKSFTSIGNIYGGGYGRTATMVGNPEVNINVLKGKYSGQTSADIFENKGFVLEDDPNIAGKKRYSKTVDKDNPHTVYVPAHEENTIGAIYNVFGGGNAAAVIGTPHVNVGTLTGEVITLASKKIEDSEGKAPTDEGWIPSYQLATAEGVDIRGNVYGAGNNAPVTGDTEVVIGKNNDVKTYIFKSYSEGTGGTAWSSGLAQTTGVTKNGNAEVVILSNGKYTTFVGQKYYVAPNATTDGSTRTALKDENGGETGLWVAISKHKTYNFKSWSALSGGTQYSTGTAVPTGNFKTFDGNEYMQIQVLTNPGETSWEGKTFFIITTAKTDGTRYQLYKADGTTENVWVTITE